LEDRTQRARAESADRELAYCVPDMVRFSQRRSSDPRRAYKGNPRAVGIRGWRSGESSEGADVTAAYLILNPMNDPILRAGGVETLFVSGVSGNAVVQAAVREGHDRDYRIVLLEDCCSALNAEEHDAAIRLLSGFASISSSKAVDFCS